MLRRYSQLQKKYNYEINITFKNLAKSNSNGIMWWLLGQLYDNGEHLYIEQEKAIKTY